MQINLEELGFDQFFNDQFEKINDGSLIPARIITQKRNSYDLLCEKGFFNGKISGNMRQKALFKSELPAVGDWVAISVKRDRAYISHIFERKSCITRKTSGKVFDQQVLSANIDILFIVSSLDGDFNINRIRRYISLAKAGKVKPVILLSKADLVKDTEPFLRKLSEAISEITIYTVSINDIKTPEIFGKYLKKGITAAFVGSSGVGKSTLINMLLGENRQKTGEISELLKKGKHTTSSRELIILKTGGMVIDTPGIRELQVWNEDLNDGYEDIEKFAEKCRFSDCEHDTEPDCEVKKAIENGLVSLQKLQSWRLHKLEIEELEKMKKLAAKILTKRKTTKKKV